MKFLCSIRPNPCCAPYAPKPCHARSHVSCHQSVSVKFAILPTQRTMNSPFRPPVKNIFTMNTCNAAMATINPPSIKLKLKILLSVLFTVLKFLFSRVRKYFCCRVRVEIWLDNFSTVSSTPLSCSVETPAFCGRLALYSFSTCKILLEDCYA